MTKPACALLIAGDTYFHAPVKALLRENFDVVSVNPLQNDVLWAALPEYVFNFLSPVILRGVILKNKCVNFHPSPPQYRGRGGASFAIYNGDTTFGATAHIMDEKIDHGPIICTTSFPIYPTDNCESLFAQAEMDCFKLLRHTVDRITSGLPLIGDGKKWTGEAVSRADFQKWLVVDSAKSDELDRKVKAARHSRFPGPYVRVKGHTFQLSGK